MYWFCHTSTCIHHRYTRVPHPEPLSLLLPRMRKQNSRLLLLLLLSHQMLTRSDRSTHIIKCSLQTIWLIDTGHILHFLQFILFRSMQLIWMLLSRRYFTNLTGFQFLPYIWKVGEYYVKYYEESCKAGIIQTSQTSEIRLLT